MKYRIWVAGHRGMVGSALTRALSGRQTQVLTVNRDELDLRDQGAVTRWLIDYKPDAIIFAAAKVGGILANHNYPADFIYDNLVLATNVIQGAHSANIDRLVFLGSSCIYPKFAPQPIPEDALLTGSLEPTNEWYAIAKIAGIKLCQAYHKQYNRKYFSLMPCNLYGPNDNFDLNTSHVMPALIRKFHEAKTNGEDSVSVWGTGKPMREFLHVDDLAKAVIHCLENYADFDYINCGFGQDISIGDLAQLIGNAVGFKGNIVFDRSKPDGTPKKLMDSSRILGLGWRPQISLVEGISSTYEWYLQNSVHSVPGAKRSAGSVAV